MLSDHAASHPDSAVQTSAPALTIATSETRSSTRSRHKKCSKRKMELRSRRLIKHSKPDLGQNAAISTANSLTPLLQLPAEIRNRIYEFVLGGNLLCIKRNKIEVKRAVANSNKGSIKQQRFTHEICRWPASEKQQDNFTIEDGTLIRDTGVYVWLCDSVAGCPRLDINLLHTCRQIYNEARFVPYSMNAFSFDTPRNLRAFTHFLLQRGINVNKAIRSLYIDQVYEGHNDHEWVRAFETVTRHMTLLNSCCVTFNWVGLRSQQEEVAGKGVVNCFQTSRKWPAQSIVTFLSQWTRGELV